MPRRFRNWLRAHAPQLFFTAIALLVWLFIHADFGISWDEAVQVAFGEKVRKYFAAGCDYSKIASFSAANAKYYAPGTDLLVATLVYALRINPFLCLNAVSGLFWAGTFWPVCSLGRRLAGKAGGWFAGMALLGMPVYLGHGFINPKDVPLACAIACFLSVCSWASSAAARSSASRRARFNWRHGLAMGAAFGFVLAMRPGAWFCLVLLGLPASTLLFHRWLSRLRSPVPNINPVPLLSRPLLRILLLCGAAIPVAWLIMVAPWPYAHQNPIANPVRAISYASHFDELYQVLFAGRIWPSKHLPWNYYFVYFGITTPLFVLLLAIFGHISGALSAWHRALAFPVFVGCLFMVWFPLTYFLVARPNVYDGLRHFLFLLPLFAVLAGAGAAACVRLLPQRLGFWVRHAIPALCLLAGVPSLITMHPYQYAYYNFLAGNRETLHERFETDFWVTSYREAAEWLNSKKGQNPQPMHVLIAANPHSMAAFGVFVRPDIQFSATMDNYLRQPIPPQFDYYVASVRYGLWTNFSGSPIIHRIERDGILMSVIRARQSPETN
jgi:hypothetical protein